MKKRNAFTLVELLVVISIIALLVGILLPALSRARDAAMVNSSKNNIRNIYMANQNYNAAWKGRQFVGAPSNLGKFGSTAGECIQNYLNNIGAYGGAYGGEMFDGWAPGPGVQFGETQGGTVVFPGNVPEYIIPYLWESGPCSTTSGAARYGTHMHPNARQIAEYMEDQIVNKAYFAPKDVIVLDGLKDCFSSQGNLCPGVKGEWGGDFGSFGIDEFGGYGWGPAIPYVSYIYSPANMFNPRVFQYKGDATPGFTDPCTFNSGFQAPTLDQSKYASLKGYLIESHWLQNVTGENCSPTWDNLPTSGTLAWRNTTNDDGWHWGGCLPALYLHSFRSTPVATFNDGHVDMLDVNACDKADNIVAAANEARYGGDNLCGTWNRNTPDGDNGYWLEAGTDWMDVSFFTHTTDGSNGRDIVQDVLGNQ